MVSKVQISTQDSMGASFPKNGIAFFASWSKGLFSFLSLLDCAIAQNNGGCALPRHTVEVLDCLCFVLYFNRTGL